MRQEQCEFHGLLDPLELIDQSPGEAFATSRNRQWTGLEAARYRQQPPNETFQPALTHHALVTFLQTPRELEVRSDGIALQAPPPAGSVLVVPAGGTAWWRWGGGSDSLHVFVDPERVARVASETFDLDLKRSPILPHDGLALPQLRSAMLALNGELTDDATGGGLVVESLANLVAVQLIRNALAPVPPVGRTDSPLPTAKLRAVTDYIEDHLDADLSLQQMAAVVHMSVYHFARRFKMSTGVPPHQYVISRRVERAQRLFGLDAGHSLAQIAARTGFADQSHFSYHFKRLTGLTPGQFRVSARNTQDSARPSKSAALAPPTSYPNRAPDGTRC